MEMPNKANGNKTEIIKTELDLSLFNKFVKCSYLDLPVGSIGKIQKQFHA